MRSSISVCLIIESIAYDPWMPRVFKKESAIISGIVLVAPLSDSQHALSRWGVFRAPARLFQLPFLGLLTNPSLIWAEGAAMEADNKLQLHRLSGRAKCADVSWGAIRLTARAPKSAMIGSMFCSQR